MTTIQANFDQVDLAELAISRLRKAIPGIALDYSGPRNSLPGDAPFRASVLYPGGAAGLPHTGMGLGRDSLGSRVLFTGDILGLPIYRSGGADLRICVSDEEAERAGALLVKAGARGVKKTVREERRSRAGN